MVEIYVWYLYQQIAQKHYAIAFLQSDGQETYIVNLFLFDTMEEVSVLTKSLHIAPKKF